MPEGRMLKKAISDSKSLAKLKSDSSRLLYSWLIPHLDVEGRYSADPELIKGHIFPKIKSMTIIKIKKILDDLTKNRLIILYKIDGEKYLELKKFKNHQKINTEREAKSKIPSPTSVGSEITPDNSGVNPENSYTSKVKSKLNESKVKVNSSCLEKIPNYE